MWHQRGRRRTTTRLAGMGHEYAVCCSCVHPLPARRRTSSAIRPSRSSGGLHVPACPYARWYRIGTCAHDSSHTPTVTGPVRTHGLVLGCRRLYMQAFLHAAPSTLASPGITRHASLCVPYPPAVPSCMTLPPCPLDTCHAWPSPQRRSWADPSHGRPAPFFLFLAPTAPHKEQQYPGPRQFVAPRPASRHATLFDNETVGGRPA